MSQLVPATEGECEWWSNRTVIRKEQEKKKKTRGKEGKEYSEVEEEETGGACEVPDHRGPRRPLTLIMTSEVRPRVRGCVKVPVRQFTPVLGDDDLMQPPQPVWHDQCCSVPEAPKGRTSISNQATQGPLKAPCRQSQWGRGKGTQIERSGKAKGQKACFYMIPSGSFRVKDGTVIMAPTQRMCVYFSIFKPLTKSAQTSEAF